MVVFQAVQKILEMTSLVELPQSGPESDELGENFPVKIFKQDVGRLETLRLAEFAQA